MHMRNWTLRHWLGHLMVIAMLFTQSGWLWADTFTVAMPAQHHMQHNCHNQQAEMTGSGHQHCLPDCCQQNKACAGHCLTICLSGGVTYLPTALLTVYPYFHITSTHITQALAPDGTHILLLSLTLA
jgi:hypothetical protein